MQLQLAALARQEGYSREGLVRCLRGLEMDGVLVRALRVLAERGGDGKRRDGESDGEGGAGQGSVGRAEMVIASDANEVFIHEVLDANGMAEGVFRKVYTNRARWLPPSAPEVRDLERANASIDTDTEESESSHTTGSEDVLYVEPYQPSDTPHGCSRCAANMCKSSILVQAKQDLRLDSDRIRSVYAGDGFNDYCPALSLGPGDLLLVREGYSLDKILKRDAEDTASAATTAEDDSQSPKTADRRKVVAEVKHWKTQEDLGRLLLALAHGNSAEEEVNHSAGPGETGISGEKLEEAFARRAVL